MLLQIRIRTVHHCDQIKFKEVIMNKLLLVAVAFVAVISLVRCDESSSEKFLEHVKSKHLKKILKDKKETVDSGMSKLEEQCPGVTEKLEDALKAFGQCDDAVDDSLTICAAIRNHALNCTQPLLKVVDDCLPQKAKGLPYLGAKSLISVADYLCKLDGESIFELFNPCLWDDIVSSSSSTDEESECEKKISAKIDEYKNEIPSTHDICTIATDLRTCIKEDTQTSCKNEKTKSVSLGLYDALIHPCSTLVNN